MECKVCCEKFNKTNHKKAVCPFCDFDVCRECVQTNLLNSVSDPKCMNCSRGWSREVLESTCTKSFRDNQYKKHRETILLEREKCFLPEAIPEVAKIREIRRIDGLIADCQQHIADIQRTIYNLANTKQSLENRTAQVTEKREFIRKCPVENCRGFLSTRWKCEVCENNICKECNGVTKGDTHTCDPNDVETVKLLKKDTKPCPGCGEMIFKISGCSQMWCPSCHVAFDWITLRIEKGRIHNPHFYEFNRRNNTLLREPGDIPCGGMPNAQELSMKMWPTRFTPNRRFYGSNNVPGATPEELTVNNIHRFVTHVQTYELNRNFREAPVDTLKLRVNYLMNDITEDQLKVTLQRIEKTREKIRDIRDVLNMFCDVMSDIFRQFMLNAIEKKDIINTYEGLRTYTTESFKTIHKRYNCATPLINDRFEMISCNWKKPKKEEAVQKV